MDKRTTGMELILNAAEGALQIILTDNEKLLCAQDWRIPNRSAEVLAPALHNLFSLLNLRLAFLRRIACVTGPGSFTGIRLILTTAAVLRRTSRAQLASLNYLQALATTAVMQLNLLYPARVIVITHARHNLAHFQSFVSYGPQIPAQPDSEAQLKTPREILAILAETSCHVCGSAVKRNPEFFTPAATGMGIQGAPCAMPLPALVQPDPPALQLLARHGDYFPKDLEPNYIRACDAVENLDELAARHKLNPDNARAKLDSLLNQMPLD